MASQILYREGVLLVYCKGFATARRNLFAALLSSKRNYSSSRGEGEDDKDVGVVTAVASDAKLVVPPVEPPGVGTKSDKAAAHADPTLPGLDIKSGILGPADSRAVLPGNVGFGLQHHDWKYRMFEASAQAKIHTRIPTTNGPSMEDLKALGGEVVSSEEGDRGREDEKTNQDLVTALAPLPPHTNPLDLVNKSMSNYQSQLMAMSALPMAPALHEDDAPAPAETMLECRAQTCPRLLHKDVRSLFPGWPSNKWPLTAITLSQRTINDMATYSEDVEVERADLVDQFVETAKAICRTLADEGYWADFLDPSSGRPYYGPYTNDTMFETDDRYRFLGFTIEDLGCCKVLTHRLFGSHVFVGAIFTTAPVSSEVVEEAMESRNSSVVDPAADGE